MNKVVGWLVAFAAFASPSWATTVAAFQRSARGEAVQIVGGYPVPAIMKGGRQIGVYVDNEEPNRCQVSADQRKVWSLVIVSYFEAGQRPCRINGVIDALEWYWPAVKPPPARAYIIQRYFHWPHEKPVPGWKQRRMLKWVIAHDPLYVIWF